MASNNGTLFDWIEKFSGKKHNYNTKNNYCKYCKCYTDHNINTCSIVKAKDERKAQHRKEYEYLMNLEFVDKHMFILSMGNKFGNYWYRKVENTDYDSETARSMRFDEIQYMEMEKHNEKVKINSYHQFLDSVTPNNARFMINSLSFPQLYDLTFYHKINIKGRNVLWKYLTPEEQSQLEYYHRSCTEINTSNTYW